MAYIIILYIIFGILPSLVWLFYYLRKDIHPEPKKTIIKIFFWGVFVTIPVFFAQVGLAELLGRTNLNPLIVSIIHWFLVIAFVEEFFKFLIVKFRATNIPEMDEPVDIVIYMIVVALGFAAVENILYLFAPIDGVPLEVIINRTVIITFIRFIGATFLHTLCSALVGYSMAVSFEDQKKTALKVAFGIFAATLLHGLYDFSIIQLSGPLKFIIPAGIILSLFAIVLYGFRKLKRIKSVTLLNN